MKSYQFEVNILSITVLMNISTVDRIGRALNAKGYELYFLYLQKKEQWVHLVGSQ